LNQTVTIDGQQGTINADGSVRMGSDSQQNVLFYVRDVLDPIESQRRNRPWKKGVLHVRIQNPGEKDTVDRPVREGDDAIFRYPRQWQQYQQSKTQVPDGTDISILFPSNPEIAGNLHTMGVHTVEQLSRLNDHGVQSIGMGAMQWRSMAQKYLTAASGGAGLRQVEQALAKAQNENEVLKNQMSLMKAQLDTLSAQVNQRIPNAMIPQYQPSIAQASIPAMQFSNDGIPDPEVADNSALFETFHTADYRTPAADDSQPLFEEEGVEAMTQAALTAPPAPERKKPGRKPGWSKKPT
jgi:hypothetical protein